MKIVKFPVEELGDKTLEKKNDSLYEKAFEVFNEKVLFLGENLEKRFSFPKAFFNYFENVGKEPCLIVFGARPFLKEGDWLKELIDYGFPIKNILLVGTRKFEFEEIKFINKNIRNISVEELMFDLEAKTDAIMEFGYGKKVYVSIDLNVVDPAYAPGVNFCEPGGLSSREFLYITKRLSKMKNLQAVDVTGLNSKKDFNEVTSKLKDKIVKQFL